MASANLGGCDLYAFLAFAMNGAARWCASLFEIISEVGFSVGVLCLRRSIDRRPLPAEADAPFELLPFERKSPFGAAATSL